MFPPTNLPRGLTLGCANPWTSGLGLGTLKSLDVQMRPRPEHLLRGAPALCHGCPEGSLGTASLLPQPSEWLPPAVCMFVMAMCLSAAMCLHRIFLARLCLSLFILLLCLHERGGNFCFQSGARETSYCYGRSDGWEVISHWILQGWSRGGFLPESGPEGEGCQNSSSCAQERN